MSEFPQHIDPATVRRFVDGELAPQERAELEAAGRMPELQRQAQFEQKLRERVSAVMSDTPDTPADLADRIRQGLRAGAAAADTDPADTPIARLGSPNAEPTIAAPHRQPFVRANRYAIAASILLVASAVLVGIFGKPIDRWFQPSAAGAAEVSEYVTQEHDRLVRSETARENKIDFINPETARHMLSDKLGLKDKLVTVFDLESAGLNYQFVGGGMCAVSHCEGSAHLIYRRTGERGPAMASVFIGHNYDQSFVRTKPGNWQKMQLTDRCTHQVFYSTDGSLVYLLVCCDSSDMQPLAEAIGSQLAAADAAAGQ